MYTPIIKRVNFSGNVWAISLLFVLMMTGITVVCGLLHRETERLRRGNWELEGAVGRPGRMVSWIPRAAIALCLLPSVSSLAAPSLLVLLRAREATAQLPPVVMARAAEVRFATKETPPATQLFGPKPRLPDHGCETLLLSGLWSDLEAAAAKESLSTDLLQAVIFRESRFLPCAVSSSGAQGLMQLMPGTAAELGVRDPFDPRQSIEGGARYLGALMVRYHGDVELALAAYHAGPAKVDAHGSIPPIAVTRTYVNDIMALAGLSRKAD